MEQVFGVPAVTGLSVQRGETSKAVANHCDECCELKPQCRRGNSGSEPGCILESFLEDAHLRRDLEIE